jgi:type IV secretory pathway TraG/TraD family ATPase VirD4
MPTRPLALIAIDEFSVLDADNIGDLLARGRESGLGVLLSTQEMIDFERMSPGFQDKVMGLANTTIAHRQNSPDSAEYLARMIGTETVWKYTHAIHRPPTLGETIAGSYRKPVSVGSKREVEEFRIHPNQIKDLPTGRALLIDKTQTPSARILDVIPGPRPYKSNGN